MIYTLLIYLFNEAGKQLRFLPSHIFQDNINIDNQQQQKSPNYLI